MPADEDFAGADTDGHLAEDVLVDVCRLADARLALHVAHRLGAQHVTLDKDVRLAADRLAQSL